MTWSFFPGNYRELHFGAGGGSTDPFHHPAPAATHANAGEIDGVKRNAYYRDPRSGMAASIQGPSTQAVATKPHDSELDGFLHSEISAHPDGRFGLNTAATSSDSTQANYEHFVQANATGYTQDAITLRMEAPYGMIPSTTEGLIKARGTRTEGKDVLIVKDKVHSRTTTNVAHATSWSVQSLALLALGTWGAYRVVFPYM